MDADSFFINLSYNGLKTSLHLVLLVTVYIPFHEKSKIAFFTYIIEFLGWLSAQGIKLISKSEVENRLVQYIYREIVILIIDLSRFANRCLKNFINSF